MRALRVCGFALVLAALSFGQASAASITTTFASNNGLDGNMFDVTTFGNALTITGLEVNVTTDVAFTIDVYLKSGTYAGSQTAAGDWTLVASGSAIGNGGNVPTFVDISDFGLTAGSLNGFYVTMNPTLNAGGQTYMNYTNGTGSYSNADLRLDLGDGVGGLFGSDAIFTGRIWNGTVVYEVATAPEPASLALLSLGLLAAGLTRRAGRAGRAGR